MRAGMTGGMIAHPRVYRTSTTDESVIRALTVACKSPGVAVVATPPETRAPNGSAGENTSSSDD
jgi:hypothetical protein